MLLNPKLDYAVSQLVIFNKLYPQLSKKIYYQLQQHQQRYSLDAITSKEIQIVIAHYQEDLNWTYPYRHLVYIYHKGGQLESFQKKYPWIPTSQWEILDNVGRESHTYLSHIISYFNSIYIHQ